MKVPRFEWPIVEARYAAEMLGMTLQRLRQLVKDGFIEVEGRNQYRVDKVSLGYVKFLKDEERRTSKSAGASAISMKKAELVDVQIEERVGDLKRQAIEQALLAVDAVIGPLKSDMYAIAPRVTRDLALRKKIEAEVERVLEAASLGSRRAKSGEVEGGRTAKARGKNNA